MHRSVKLEGIIFPTMKKIEATASILETVKQELAEWFAQEGLITSGYEYETKILEMGQRISQKILKESIGPLPKSRNEKKTSNLSRSRRGK